MASYCAEVMNVELNTFHCCPKDFLDMRNAGLNGYFSNRTF